MNAGVLDFAPERIVPVPARVGPNAILQVAAVLRERCSEQDARAVFSAAGLVRYLSCPPEHMTDEREAAALHRALFRRFPNQGPALAAEAGTRTADYLLAHRIPKLAQVVLKRLPAGWAARLLVKAIGRHAWTFAGSGAFRATFGASPTAPALVLEIAHNPLAMPDCPWHQAVFTRLFQELVSPTVRVRHTDCCARGQPVCRFELDWR
jgi:divinyl protochlorophyllide a 8-vinyl-reductase